MSCWFDNNITIVLAVLAMFFTLDIVTQITIVQNCFGLTDVLAGGIRVFIVLRIIASMRNIWMSIFSREEIRSNQR